MCQYSVVDLTGWLSSKLLTNTSEIHHGIYKAFYNLGFKSFLRHKYWKKSTHFEFRRKKNPICATFMSKYGSLYYSLYTTHRIRRSTRTVQTVFLRNSWKQETLKSKTNNQRNYFETLHFTRNNRQNLKLGFKIHIQLQLSTTESLGYGENSI